jgi:lactoylglutathione lyase
VTALRLELFVQDLDRSARFYERVLGFSKEPHEDSRYVPMRRGDARLGLGAVELLAEGHPLRTPAGQGAGLGVEIVLELPDVEVAHEHVRATGHPLADELVERPWGLRDFRLRDPDGYYIRVTERPDGGAA